MSAAPGQEMPFLDHLEELRKRLFWIAGAILVGEARRIGRQIGAGRHAALDRRPFADLVKPALDVGKVVDVDIAVLQQYGPRIANHVGDRVIVGCKISVLKQTQVQYSVEPMNFIVEA